MSSPFNNDFLGMLKRRPSTAFNLKVVFVAIAYSNKRTPAQENIKASFLR